MGRDIMVVSADSLQTPCNKGYTRAGREGGSNTASLFCQSRVPDINCSF